MKMRMKLVLLSIVIAHFSFAQNGHPTDSLPGPPLKKHSFHLLGGQNEKAREGKLLLTPFFFPGYTPDIQYSVAGGAIISFSTKPSDSTLPRSSTPLTVTYSSTHAFILSTSMITFWLHDHLRVYAFIQYKNYMDAYFGIGYENAVNTSFPDSTNFNRSFFIFQLRPLWKLHKHLFAGINMDFNQNILWNINPHMKHDPNYQEFGQYIVNTGIGGIVSYDSRDVAQNPYRGIYSTLIYTSYQKATGGNTQFQALDFDTRWYLPLSATKVRILAINWRSRYDFGSTPFTSLISLGTSQDLRGLRFGQFRDQYLNYLITEYRYKFYRNDKPTRFGFVVWTGMGAIGGSVGQAFFQQPLTDFGLGFRFEVQPRLNVRVDLGFSSTHTATYVNFLESY